MNKALHAKELLGKHISRQRKAKQFRLPPERALAEQFGYSRATVGKALGVLEGEGIIFRKKGSGTFITKNDKERTMTIALVMRMAYHYTDTHFRLIVEEVSKYAEKHNIYIQIFDNLPEIFKKNPDKNSLIQAIESGTIDGVLIVSRMPISILNRISAICPTVSINNIFGDGSEIPCISCDYFFAGFLAGKHLLEKGHRKVAYITENFTNSESTFEFSGFKAALGMVGVDLTNHNILECKQNSDIFTKRVLDFFKNSAYRACFVRTTRCATKIFSVLQRSSFERAEKLSFIAIGNYDNECPNNIRLTIIDNQLAKMCRIGLQTVQSIINNNKTKGGLKLLAPKIIENNSVINLNKIK